MSCYSCRPYCIVIPYKTPQCIYRKRNETQIKADTSWQRESAHLFMTTQEEAVWQKVRYTLAPYVCITSVLPLVESVTTHGLKIASVRMQSYLYSSRTLPASFNTCFLEYVCVYVTTDCAHLMLALLCSIALISVFHFHSPCLTAFVSLRTHTHT